MALVILKNSLLVKLDEDLWEDQHHSRAYLLVLLGLLLRATLLYLPFEINKRTSHFYCTSCNIHFQESRQNLRSSSCGEEASENRTRFRVRSCGRIEGERYCIP